MNGEWTGKRRIRIPCHEIESPDNENSLFFTILRLPGSIRQTKLLSITPYPSFSGRLVEKSSDNLITPLIHTRPRNYPNCPIPAHPSPRQGPKLQSNCHWDLSQRRLQSTTLTIHDIQVILQERCHTSVSETNNGPITYFYFSATPEKLVFWMISSVYLETQVLLLAEHDPFTSNMMIPRNSQEMLRPSFVNLMIWTKTSAHDTIVTTLMSASKTHKTHLRHEEKLHPYNPIRD